jgi:hypothetical protein
MKPSAIRIERMLEKLEAALVPPPRKCLHITIDEGDDEAEAKEKALAEHVARHPEDVGRTVEDFDWIGWVIVHPKFIIGAEPDLSEGAFEDTNKETDGPSETPGPIDLLPPAGYTSAGRRTARRVSTRCRATRYARCGVCSASRGCPRTSLCPSGTGR